MLSVIIATHQSERLLPLTLAALVPGAIEGLVSEVLVADAGSTDATTAVADAAGCVVLAHAGALPERLRDAAGTARSAWLLFLRTGFVPAAGWTDAVGRFVAAADMAGPVRAATFRAGLAGAGRSGALRGAARLLWRALARPLDPDCGLLIRKVDYLGLGGHRDGADPETDLLRRIGRGRLTVLDCDGAPPPRWPVAR